MSRADDGRRPAGLWWLSPLGAVSLLVPVSVWLTWHLSDADFELFYREPKSVTPANLLLVIAAVLVLAGVAQLVANLAPAPTGRQLMPAGETPRLLRRASSVLFWLTMLGYAAYFGSGLARGVTPAILFRALVSQDTYGVDLKNAFGGIAGLTTLTQCGVAFVVVSAHLLRRRHRTRALVVQLTLVLVLALVRAYVASERLALIEVAVPVVVIVVMAARRGARGRRRVAARLAPIVLAPLLILLFGLFEYSRSWQYFKTRTDQPFALFSLIRFIGYYATSYNNGYIEMTYGRYPGRLPLNSLAALWDAPGISALDLYDKLSAPAPETASNLLERFASPEFNNPGGVTTPFVDFGLFGGFVFLLLVGVVLGLLYRGFRAGTITGSLLYPVALIGLFDLPRYLYWTQGRVVPAWAALIIVAVLLNRAEVSRPRAASRRPARPPSSDREIVGSKA